MSKGKVTRQRMIDTAQALIQRQGYAATGLQQILTESSTPRGSFYFHFPGGKEDLARAVIHNHGAQFAEQIDELAAVHGSALRTTQALIDQLTVQMETSNCTAGCPVTHIAMEQAGKSNAVQAAAREVYEAWRGRFVKLLRAEGHEPELASTQARTVLSAIEGALLLSRAYGSAAPLEDLHGNLPTLLAVSKSTGGRKKGRPEPEAKPREQLGLWGLGAQG